MGYTVSRLIARRHILGITGVPITTDASLATPVPWPRAAEYVYELRLCGDRDTDLLKCGMVLTPETLVDRWAANQASLKALTEANRLRSVTKRQNTNAQKARERLAWLIARGSAYLEAASFPSHLHTAARAEFRVLESQGILYRGKGGQNGVYHRTDKPWAGYTDQELGRR